MHLHCALGRASCLFCFMQVTNVFLAGCHVPLCTWYNQSVFFVICILYYFSWLVAMYLCVHGTISQVFFVSFAFLLVGCAGETAASEATGAAIGRGNSSGSRGSASSEGLYMFMYIGGEHPLLINLFISSKKSQNLFNVFT